MNAEIFDLIILVTLAIYTGSGLLSGFIVQFARFFSLIAAFWAMSSYSSVLSPHLQFIQDQGWRTIVASVILFIGVMLAIGILARILKKIVSFSFGGWLDKLLGAALGLTVGVLFWSIIILLLKKMFPDAEFLINSRLVPWFSGAILQIREFLPADLAKYINI